MVKNNNEGEEQQKRSFVGKEAVAGALSGGATRFICQPLDVLKIRFQVQVEPIKKCSNNSAVYKGIFQGLSHIFANEGLKGLWKGHIAAQALSITFGFVQFGLFGAIQSETFKNAPVLKEFQAGVNFSAGYGAGCLATMISFPLDTIRTRLVVQGEPKVYSGMLDVATKMWLNEGPLSLYRGLMPTLIQIGPYAGCQFAFYKFLINVFDRNELGKSLGVRSLLCGAVAGAAAKTLVYPLDLGKKRMQVHGFHRQHVYKGLFDCLSKTVRNEGLPALFKGLRPALLKAFFSSALQFYFYEISLHHIS